MTAWWSNISSINQVFYSVAAFFSIFFIWQLISALMGLDADDADTGDAGDVSDGDLDTDHTYDDFEDGAESDSADTTMAFKLLSIRSIITFCTLFSWGTALYLHRGEELGKAMGISVIWGMAGMLSVALIFWSMRKLTHTGTANLNSCVGTEGAVYLDIPENGFGEIKVTVSDVVTHVKAKSVDGKALKANTLVRVKNRLGQNTVEVEPVNKETQKGETE